MATKKSMYEFCFTISGETIEEFQQKYEKVRPFLSMFEGDPGDAPRSTTLTVGPSLSSVTPIEPPSVDATKKRKPGRPPKTKEELPAPVAGEPVAVPTPSPAPAATRSVSSSFTATKQEAIAALTALLGAKGELESRKILKALGVDRFSKLDPKDYGNLVAACNAVMAPVGAESLFA